MKTKTLTALLLIISALGVSQTAEDALRYSRVFYSGTARFNGLGGAFGALGADFSTLATNPGGIGLYQGSEVTFTLAPHIANTSGTYNGFSTSDSRVNFGIGNFGSVFSINLTSMGVRSVVKRINFGFGMNRQNDFSNRVSIAGPNMKNSLITSYVNVLNENRVRPADIMDSYPFDIGRAWDANLIVFDSASSLYSCDAQYGGVMQSKLITSYGSMNELDIAMGVNIADQLFVGLNFGIPFINYYEASIYQENRLSDTIPEFIALQYNYNLQTRGTGFNIKFGMIYRPTNWLRLGASVHTPTWFSNMKDEWSSSMSSQFQTSAWNYTSYSPIGYYDYKLRTPFRAMGSLAFIIGHMGLVSADYEYVNYSQARFNSDFDSYTSVNNTIENSYRSWGNIRIGTEWVFGDFRVRGGFAYFSNPYDGAMSNTNNSERLQASGGIGYRSKYFFADLTYVWARTYQNYYLYDATMVAPADLTLNSHSVLTTVGFRF